MKHPIRTLSLALAIIAVFAIADLMEEKSQEYLPKFPELVDLKSCPVNYKTLDVVNRWKEYKVRFCYSEHFTRMGKLVERTVGFSKVIVFDEKGEIKSIHDALTSLDEKTDNLWYGRLITVLDELKKEKAAKARVTNSGFFIKLK